MDRVSRSDDACHRKNSWPSRRHVLKLRIMREFKSFAVALSALVLAQTGLAQTKAPGVVISFTGENKAADMVVVSNATFYVPAGEAPSPFVPAGKFTAVLNGLIAVDLRGDYAFQADVNGTLKLEVNGQVLLDVTTNGTTEASKNLRLGKGATNTLVATFSSPAQGDAFLRLRWKPTDSFFHPIPSGSLSHNVQADESKFETVRMGRELFLENRCAKCHVPGEASGIPELAMDAPSFEDIGTRRNYEWMARWILDPKALRSAAHMPKLLQGEKAKEAADAMASYLASLHPEQFKPGTQEFGKDKADLGKKLFESLHCIACHNPPDGNEADEKKISLKETAAKFVPGTLTAFLKQPDAHYAWTHMPRFSLNDEQREQLAIYVLSHANPAKPAASTADKTVVERGKELVQTSGCLNCHSLKLDNKFSTKTLAQLSDFKKGCLAEAPDGKTPDFGFKAEQREAIRAFAATDKASLTRHVPADFAARYSRVLNCRNCHGQFEGFPQFEILGGKLKPEYMTKLVAGAPDNKPRPWLESQMPGFPKFAEPLAKGLAALNGFPPLTPAEGAISDEKTATGNKLVSNPPLGFACISCHSVGSVGALQVFEAPGINLAFSGERLQPEFFKRWLRNPPLVDPQTKMPVYFDEQGRSPIADVYEGDGVKQIDALWDYIRLGSKMPPPKTD